MKLLKKMDHESYDAGDLDGDEGTRTSKRVHYWRDYENEDSPAGLHALGQSLIRGNLAYKRNNRRQLGGPPTYHTRFAKPAHRCACGYLVQGRCGICQQ